MTDRRSNRWWPAAPILLLLLPLIYLFSLGPVLAVFSALGQPEPMLDVINTVYWPIGKVLPEPLLSWFNNYLGLWQ